MLLLGRQVAGPKSSKTSPRAFLPTGSPIKLPRAVLMSPDWPRGAKGVSQEGGRKDRALGLSAHECSGVGKGLTFIQLTLFLALPLLH